MNLQLLANLTGQEIWDFWKWWLLVAIWIFMAVLVGRRSARLGKDPVAWMWLALLFTPPLIWLIAEATSSGQGRMMKCPKCYGRVPAEAKICQHCRTEFLD